VVLAWVTSAARHNIRDEESFERQASMVGALDDASCPLSRAISML